MFKATLLMIITFLTHCILADVCTDFRISSPPAHNLTWTAGQCYQMTYDVVTLGDIDRAKISVEVYQANTNKKVSRVVQEELIDFETGATKAFNLDVGRNVTTEIASYYYLVTLYYGERKCQPQKSVEFQVLVNPYSPTTKCHN